MNPNRYLRIVLSAVAGGLLLLGLLLWLADAPATVSADPGTLFASPSGSGDCSQFNPCTLQTALDNAVGGDVIYLAAGTYTGTGGAVITLTKSITLYGGWDGTATTPPVRDPENHRTVLDGEGQRRVIYILGNISPTIDGLVIARGNATSAPVNAGYGGGIYSWGGASPIIANNLITDNVARTGAVGNGGGICIVSPAGTAVITDNRVISNVASLANSGSGGGIYLLNAPGAQVVNNIVLSNTAAITDVQSGYGGGIGVSNSDGAVLRGNRLEHNVANAEGRGYGGGIYLGGSVPVTVTGNVVLSNTASLTGGLGYGGGVAILGNNGAVLTDNRIEHNVAQGGPAATFGSRGGGIYCFLSDDMVVRDNLIRHNTTSVPANGSGGGIDLWGCDWVTVARNTIQGNFGSTGGNGYGGGLHAYASQGLLIEANRIISNTASTSPWGWGGGLYLSRKTTFTMTNDIVAANHASWEGGGMAFETSATEPVTGTLAHNTFAANNRGSGDGRIAIYLNDPHITLVLTNNLIYSHTYGVYAVTGSTATLYNTLFYSNSASDTGGTGLLTNTDPITGQDPLLDADYHLQDGSPAIDAGVPLPWLTTDVDGDPRPDGSGYDIGADEFRLHKIYLPLVVRNFP